MSGNRAHQGIQSVLRVHARGRLCLQLGLAQAYGFPGPGDLFQADAFRHAVDIMITAQDILVDKAGYPTPAITKNSRNMRALGLGYADLGALIMALGLPYDSDEGRYVGVHDNGYHDRRGLCSICPNCLGQTSFQ